MLIHGSASAARALLCELPLFLIEAQWSDRAPLLPGFAELFGVGRGLTWKL